MIQISEAVGEKQPPQMIRSIVCIKRDYKCDFSDRPLTAVFLIRPILDEDNYIFKHDQTLVFNIQ